MSLEQALAANTAALIALTAAMSAAGSVSAASTGDAATTTTTTTAGKGKGKAAAPKGPSREEMVAALTEVKEKFGAAEAKAIITKVGAAKMAEIADDKIDAAFKLAKSKLEASDDSNDDDNDGL